MSRIIYCFVAVIIIISTFIGICENSILVVEAQQKFTVVPGEDVIFTTFNYHSTMTSRDPNGVTPMVSNYWATSSGNNANIYIQALPWEGGGVSADIGVELDNSGIQGYNWDSIKDLPVNVTFDFTYSMDANYELNNGTACSVLFNNYFVNFDGHTFIPGDTCYDTVGYCSALQTDAGSHKSGRIIQTYSTINDGTPITLQKVLGKLIIKLHSSAFQIPGDDCDHHASVNVTLNSIKIHFIQKPVPVILVHGWHSDADAWSTIKPRLENNGYKCYTFVYDNRGDPRVAATQLGDYINKIRRDNDYDGKFDIVCHSMGALVTRYYMEEQGGANNIRQWIGIAPVNHGAAVADLRDTSLLGSTFIDGNELAFQQLKTDSYIVRSLNDNSLSPNVKYRVIVGCNLNHDTLFGAGLLLPMLNRGMTWSLEKYPNGTTYYDRTYYGDGVVANEQSRLIGAGIDFFNGLDHGSILNDYWVSYRVLLYLNKPSINSLNNYPPLYFEDISTLSNSGLKVGNVKQGILKTGESHDQLFNVNGRENKLVVALNWPGSEMDLELRDPSGTIVPKTGLSNVQFSKNATDILYVIIDPEPGTWKAHIVAIDVDDSGEEYCFTTFDDAPITINSTAIGSSTGYYAVNNITITCELLDGDKPVLRANVTAIAHSVNDTIYIPLNDEGMMGDMIKDNGVYSANITFPSKGGYNIYITALNVTDKSMALNDVISINVEEAKPDTTDDKGSVKGIPGFEAIFAIIAIFTTTYLLIKNRG